MIVEGKKKGKRRKKEKEKGKKEGRKTTRVRRGRNYREILWGMS